MTEADLGRLRRLEGIKWAKHGSDVLPAWVADMDFNPAPEIKATMHSMIESGDLGYNFAVSSALVPTWLDWNQHRHGWRPDEDECFAVTGTLHALELAMLRRTEPGDGVVLFSPIYQPFRNAIEASGRQVVDVSLHGPDWRLDPTAFEAAITDTTKAVVLCQPHNPLGRVFTETELVEFAAVCEKFDLLILNDEIWADLTLQPEGFQSLCTAAPHTIERTVTLASASKAFNLAGLRCAVAHVGPADCRPAFSKSPLHHMGSPSTISSAASIAAWTKASYWLDAVKAQLAENVEILATRVEQDLPGVSMHKPEATYLGWLDFAGSPISADPAQRILHEARVALEPGLKFGSQAGQFARINFATSPAILNEIIDRIALVVVA